MFEFYIVAFSLKKYIIKIMLKRFIERGNKTMQVNQYDHIVLKDGRTAFIVEVFEEGVAYLADVDLPGPDWDTISIRHEDIKEKLL